MIGDRLFDNEPIKNAFYLQANTHEIPMQHFITKPPACWGMNISIEIYRLLLLLIIIYPCYNSCIYDVHFTTNLFFTKGFNVKECYYPLHVAQYLSI